MPLLTLLWPLYGDYHGRQGIHVAKGEVVEVSEDKATYLESRGLAERTRVISRFQALYAPTFHAPEVKVVDPEAVKVELPRKKRR